MSTFAKAAIGAAILLVVLCIGATVLLAGSLGAAGVLAARTLKFDPAGVNTAAARIADFTLPPGYTPEATAEIAGYLYVGYSPGDGHSHIQFVQGPAGGVLDRAALEGSLRQAAGSRYQDSDAGSREIATRQATIRGQSVTLVTSEGINHDGEPFWTQTAVFEGKGGPALVSVESPVSAWHQAAVDEFIASIH